jgi:CheY-like chemotaxis protein
MVAILVVDPNEAFATLLVEELRQQAHDVTSAMTFDEALSVAEQQPFDLALLDMALEDPGAIVLAQELRSSRSDLRLMFIPMMGEDLPAEAREKVSVQGVLPKPFFLPELPERIDEALNASLSGSVGPVDRGPVPPSATGGDFSPAGEGLDLAEGVISLETVGQHSDVIEQMMDDLAQEVGADVVLLSIGRQVASAVGQLNQARTEAMAQAVNQSWTTSTKVGHILGREQVRFEQSISGGDYVLYALSIDGPAILAVAIQGTAMLGLLRHRARETADAIAALCMSSEA